MPLSLSYPQSHIAMADELAPGEITQLLIKLCDGKEDALENLMPLVYNELREMAWRHLRNERSGHTLNPTALVNEAYIRLAQQKQLNASHRTQFMAIAGTTMRRILVDYARARKRIKRGAGVPNVPLDDVIEFLSEKEADEMIAFDEALNRLEKMDERASLVVQHRFYSGLKIEEIASLLDVSVRTIHRDWTTAIAWLRKEVAQELEF